MAPVIFQAKKANWLPMLPRKDSTIRDYKMSLMQQVQYNQMEREFLLEIEAGVITVEVAIAKYAKLAQIQVGFIYDQERVVHELVRPEDNPRLNVFFCKFSTRRFPVRWRSFIGTAPCCRSSRTLFGDLTRPGSREV